MQIDDGVRTWLITTDSFTKKDKNVYFPYVQSFVIERRFLMSSGEGLDGSYATTWRESFDVITVICLQPINDNSQGSIMTMLDEIEPLSKITRIGQEFAQIRCVLNKDDTSYNIFKYYIIPIAHGIQRSADEQILEATFTFVGSEDRMAVNGYLMNNYGSRTAVPITSGKFQV
jgi:hypothetical protein